MAPYNPIEVAWRMLKVAHEREIKLSNLQLQKLVYITHGYFLGWKNEPLINTPVEAWTYGPVISSIYHEFKGSGDKKIPVNPMIQTSVDNDVEVNSVIDAVLKLYGTQNAMSLVNLTHQSETPWDETWRNKGGSNNYSVSIDNELIKNHYRKVISDPSSVKGL